MGGVYNHRKRFRAEIALAVIRDDVYWPPNAASSADGDRQGETSFLNWALPPDYRQPVPPPYSLAGIGVLQ